MDPLTVINLDQLMIPFRRKKMSALYEGDTWKKNLLQLVPYNNLLNVFYKIKA